ncbi:uncharacterized protein LOC114952598 isoform X4 [Acropora millepora]|nr:uncharacterized protein LOC114952598 isoform X4 [Acropora millepora]XP_029184405.2 uncharacterized protein LOC114952598 isoform X4 [Acropora millepora]XP_029184406.2 uncharacterized protein LOC114952598 isoform X4 [Acropora millepora]XP_029184407.2 uncharacterized protein LOC114952598 isoform X4 [Acropora millepora]
MRRVLNHAKKVRFLVLLMALCCAFMIGYQVDYFVVYDHDMRFPRYMPSDIVITKNDFNSGGLVRSPRKLSKLGRALSSYGNDKDSPSKIPKKQLKLLCGTKWQEDYMKLHRDMLNNRRPPKYLVYFCGGRKFGCGGYGNRLGAITSLFYLAVITGRAFLIDWNTTVPIEKYLRPRNIQWDFPMSKLRHLKKSYHYWGKGEHEFVNKDSQRSPVNFNLFRHWLEDTDMGSFLDSPLEIVTSLWYFAPSFLQHKFAERVASEIGVKVRGHRYSLVGCAFDFLFERTAEFERTLSIARESLNLKPNIPRIGIHIRMGDGNAFHPASLDRRTTNFNNFFTCARKLERTIIKSESNFSREDIKWFLATDTLGVKQVALKTYPNKVVSLSVKLEHINVREPSVEGLQGVLLDHFLLSESDYFVLSDSSFSKTALGMNFHSLEHSTFGDKCKYIT